MIITPQISEYIESHYEEMLELLYTIARIPAPSNHEEQRAEFCRQWLEQQGAKGVYLDDACNVIYPIGCEADRPLAVVMAHSDVVFPDTEPLPLTVEDGKIKCPGIGDDSVNVAALLMIAKYITEQKLTPKEQGVLLVINSGEEGLGNLRGSKRIVETFGSRITEFISLDASMPYLCDRAVGSKRYRIEIRTEGGHSYGKFGNRNAIAYMASLIDTLYTMKVPENGKTTYNVGTIRGGTSVNTIAQQAEMLYEFRSDQRDALETMEKHLMCAIELYRAKGAEVDIELVGDRPCGAEIDAARHQALKDRAAAAVKRYFDMDASFIAGSTDCNSALAAGIPAVCTGCYIGRGQHTREEYIELSSVLPGLRLGFDMVLYYF